MNVRKGINRVFEREWSVLELSRKRLDDSGQTENWPEAYRNLVADYEKLLKMLRKISAISDLQGLALKHREEEIANLLDNVNQGFLTVGADLRVSGPYSRECERIFGRKIAGADIVELLWGGEAPGLADERDYFRHVFRRAFLEQAAMEEPRLQEGLPIQVSCGEKYIHLSYRTIPHSDEPGNGAMILFILTDVTERLKAQEQIDFFHSHDVMTGLYNRSHMERIMQEVRMSGPLPVSLILADMNGLKLANDVFGHGFGDRLLVRAADLLRRVCGESARIARWGGDEFVILVPNADIAAIASVAERIREACAASQADPIPVSMALGCATMTRLGDSLDMAFHAAEKGMYRQKLLENRTVRVELMNSVSRALVERGIEREERIGRMLDLTDRLAKRAGVDGRAQDMELLRNLVRLHDAGKLSIPGEILFKPGPLDPEEWAIMATHSETGCRMAQSIGEWQLAEAILGLRERWDGSGYPYHIAGLEIPVMSRILAIVDAYSAMTQPRAHQAALSEEDARKEIRSGAGTQFDPKLAELFLSLLSEG